MTSVHVFEILEPLNFLCYDVLVKSNFLMKIAPSQQQK